MLHANELIKKILLIFSFVSLLNAQNIIKVTSKYILIDTDKNLGQISDILLIQRNINGMNKYIGAAKIVKFKNGKTAAEIFRIKPSASIRPGDRVSRYIKKTNKIKNVPEPKIEFPKWTWRNGLYCYLEYSFIELEDDLTESFFNQFDYDYFWSYNLSEINSVLPDKLVSFGIGYKFPIKRTISYNLLGNIFAGFDYNKFKYEQYNDSGCLSWFNWSPGIGTSIRFKNSLTFDFSLNCNFPPSKITNDIESISFYAIGSEPYLSFNLGIGFSTNSPNNGSWGIYGNKKINKHFINTDYPAYNAYSISAEVPAEAAGYALLILGLIASASESGSSSSSSSLYSPSSSKKYCHVYGNIKFVEFGEDYKVKFVNFGETLRVKYVEYLASSPGQWKIVKFGEDFRIKIVDFGEDFTVRLVSFGEGCD